MSAIKGLAIASSFSLLAAASIHNNKRQATDFSRSAMRLEHDSAEASVLPARVFPRAVDTAKAANLLLTGGRPHSVNLPSILAVQRQ